METSDYLNGSFVAEAAELKKVHDVAVRAFKTLQDFAEDGAWPYEVVQNEERAARDENGDWSHSTAAMILFAMGVASGRVASSTLAPYVSLLDDKERLLGLTFDEQFRFFAQHLRPVTGCTAWHTKSRTFGEDDPFTLLWLLEIFRSKIGDVEKKGGTWFAADRDTAAMYERSVSTAAARVRAVFDEQTVRPWSTAFAKRDDGDTESVEHTFPTLRVVQLYDHLRSAGYSGELPSYEPLMRYLQNRLHLQLSYFEIINSNYDAAELAFTMEALLLLDWNAIDTATINRCRQVLLVTQKNTSYWRPLRPFLATPQGMVLLPLSVETGNSLVRSCEILARRESRTDRSGDIALFQRYTDWLFGRIVQGETKSKKKFYGWRSEHADDRYKIHLWETSQVLVYLLQYESFLRKYRADRALHDMNLKLTDFNVDQARYTIRRSPWEIWTDGSDALHKRGPVDIAEYNIYKRIGETYIKPRSENIAGVELPYSMLFYGPQGTGKTELANSIARTLGQPLISISPSDFMVTGDTLVEARAKRLFEVLEAQPDAVILLDEIDRLILDRNSKRYEKQSDPFQLMTPGMLTKLQNLRNLSRSVFIISTNYAERIDLAIKRKGRIDNQYLVLPPDSQVRAELLHIQLKNARIPEHALPSVDGLLKDGVREAVLSVFSELKRLSVDTAKSVEGREECSLVLTTLNEHAKKSKPVIQIGSYASRFDEHLTEDQQPFEELLMLMYLVVQSKRRPLPEEKVVWKLVLGNDKDEREKKIKKYIKDQVVVEQLISAHDVFKG